MKIIDGLMKRMGYIKPAPINLRRFEAARISRLTSGWATQNAALDAEIKQDLGNLRARARDLSVNNDYARKFLQMWVGNIVGPSGFMLQAQAEDPNGQPDRLARKVIELGFFNWSMPGECDVTGRLSFNELCRLVVRAVGRDGEALVRRVRDRSFAYGYRLQLLDIDRLDIADDRDLDNGNMVRMGVELDPNGRAVAYHLLTVHPGIRRPTHTGTVTRERVPANEILHLFLPERPEQTRGFPTMSAAMQRLNMLHGYEEAAIVAARTGAAKMGFFTSPDGTAVGIADDEREDGQFISEADPGSFQILPQGYDFKSFDPDYPTANYDSFVKSCLRGIASGLGVAYNTLANDLEGVNYSSIRQGVLEERENWMVLQNWFIDAFLRPVYLDWLDASLLKSALVMPNGSALPASKRVKFSSHHWQGRRWSWVDPLKDIEASRLAIQTGIASPQQIAAQAGVDIDDVLDAIAEFEARVKEKQVSTINLSPNQEPVKKPQEQ